MTTYHDEAPWPNVSKFRHRYVVHLEWGKEPEGTADGQKVATPGPSSTNVIIEKARFM